VPACNCIMCIGDCSHERGQAHSLLPACRHDWRSRHRPQVMGGAPPLQRHTHTHTHTHTPAAHCPLTRTHARTHKHTQVRRRYSEFHDLHTRMKALGAVHSDLPSRNPLAMMGAMVREKIERERERGLQDYLNAVVE
jgi:hypothetical protein